MKIEIVVSLQIEGFHFWPNADGDVSFLRNEHRHIFYIKCAKIVTHEDRDIEIIRFKSQITKYLETKFQDERLYSHLNFQNNSCESIALLLMNKFHLSWCEVLEDNENGARVTFK